MYIDGNVTSRAHLSDSIPDHIGNLTQFLAIKHVCKHFFANCKCLLERDKLNADADEFKILKQCRSLIYAN